MKKKFFLRKKYAIIYYFKLKISILFVLDKPPAFIFYFIFIYINFIYLIKLQQLVHLLSSKV